ncbi:Dyp-type peroxidase [Archangium lipolyticum]|uniref:Dyp-type peroxidase n=1 Tax=Archangium lipolyticum TaxID=2970465 RepID=UPI002149B7BE|nr:Dyp-type peroxidase [Archangium lipolyticum]
MKQPFETHDIQALLFAGYGELRRARYLFLQMGDVARAKKWLRDIASEEVTTQKALEMRKAKGEKKRHALHVAFSASGLRKLGLSEQVVGSFLPEFVKGMAEEYRARALGDTGTSAPANWQFGRPDEGGAQDIHLVLMLFTHGNLDQSGSMDAYHQRHRQRYEAHGLREVFIQDAYLQPMVRDDGTEEGSREAFGYRDGMTQPTFEGAPLKPGQSAPVKAGEFILGYENEYGQLPFTPVVPAEQDPQGLLPVLDVKCSTAKDLGRNGSYLVIRKLRQDVDAFERFLSEHSHDPEDPEGDAARKELLAAKMMGRWRSGAPLSLCPAKDDPGLGKDPSRNNDFSFASDPKGLRCPLNAHVRRSNPRDGLIPGDPKESLKISNRHQLLRRGRPYKDPDGEQGLMFLALNANIRRQFEFVQQTWMNNPKFAGHYDSRDPIAGDNHDPAVEGSDPHAYSVTIPAEPVRQRLTGLPRFVHTRGGGYFFLPGIRALRFLAS